MKQIGDKIKELRIKCNITQRGLADLLDISPSAIGMYEQNRRLPDADLIVSLALHFGVSTDYLLGKSTDKADAKSTPNSNELEVLRSKFVKHGIIKEGEDLTDQQLDDYLKKLGTIVNAFKD